MEELEDLNEDDEKFVLQVIELKKKEIEKSSQHLQESKESANILIIEIYWDDPMNLVPKQIKEKIEIFTQLEGKPIPKGLVGAIMGFCRISPVEVSPFVKELLVAISENVDDFGWTALHHEAGKGNNSACKVLLENNSNINAQTKFTLYTPIMFAAVNGRVETVQLLLKFGADTKMKDEDGYNALKWADLHCAEIIRSHDAKLCTINPQNKFRTTSFQKIPNPRNKFRMESLPEIPKAINIYKNKL